MTSLTKIPQVGITPNLSMQWGKRKQTVRLITRDTLPHRPMHSLATCLYGRRGSSKTTDLVYFVKSQKQINLARGVRCEVWANFNLYGTMQHPRTGETIPIADVCDGYLCERVMMYDPFLSPKLMNPNIYIIIVIDEVTKALPSFRGASTYNQTFRQFIVDLRKVTADILMATQIIQEVDRGLSRQIDLFMKPQIYQKEGADGRRAYHSRILVWDHWGQFTGKQYNRPWPPDWSPYDWKINLGNIHKVWGDFTSREIIPPMWMQNRDAMLDHQGVPHVTGDAQKEGAPAGFGEKITTIDALKQTGAFQVGDYGPTLRNVKGEPRATLNTLLAWLESEGFTLTGEGTDTIAEYKE